MAKNEKSYYGLRQRMYPSGGTTKPLGAVIPQPLDYRNINHEFPDILLPRLKNILADFHVEAWIKISSERNCVKKIYSVVRVKHGSSTKQRYEEWCSSIIFNNIKENADALKKVVFVKGDLQENRLGLSDQDFNALINEVNCVFHVGAEVKFVADIDRLLLNNVFGTNEIVQMAKKMRNLQTFVYVSSGYAQCDKHTIEEVMYENKLNGENMLTLLKMFDSKTLNEMSPIILKGFPNPYVATKSLAEDLVRRTASDLPIAVVRPTIIAPALKEPVSGWTNQYQTYVRLYTFYALGLSHIIPATPGSVLDIIPLDYAVNLILATAWDLGSFPNIAQKTIKVYNHGTTHKNPLPLGRFETLLDRYDSVLPSNQKMWHRFVILTTNVLVKQSMYVFHLPILFLLDFAGMLLGKSPKYTKIYKKMHFLMNLCEHFIVNTWLIKTDNTQKLWKKLNKDDKKMFYFDVSVIDWVLAIHTFINGSRLFILKETPETLPKAQIRRRVLRVVHYVTVFVYLCILAVVVTLLVKWCL
ncbi:hypothetical protein RN001_015231 [Aquatica leii]|uniref:Fatty acyl-CoA reductase n=1 Tax=Aquatica leii TaxID=1421715 RepID=A0AAN7PQI5_9COLE|nr:hypothetical protein RN001_015231 [Aquatica leii]